MKHAKYKNAKVRLNKNYFQYEGIVIGYLKNNFVIKVIENTNRSVYIGRHFLSHHKYSFDNAFLGAIFFDCPFVLVNGYYICMPKKCVELIKHNKEEINKIILALEL